jgi:hypothetical protein
MKAKRGPTLILLGAMLFLLAACGGEPERDSSKDFLNAGSLSSQGMAGQSF